MTASIGTSGQCSLPEIWTPCLFSYMALSRLSSFSENAEELMENTQLVIFTTFFGLSEILHPSVFVKTEEQDLFLRL